MGSRGVVNRTGSVNISESARQKERNFTEQNPQNNIGPVPTSGKDNNGDLIAIGNHEDTTIYKWKVMTAGDEGLKNALYDFINTSKDGVKVNPDTVRGREKVMVFDFYGTIGKCIKPGEIGEFEVVFSYPPTVATAGQSTGTPSSE